jgi:hypothetical protein
LILVCYATLLIIVVLSLREKLLDPSKLFDWRDLFAKGDLPEDPEQASSCGGDSRGFNITDQVEGEQSK